MLRQLAPLYKQLSCTYELNSGLFRIYLFRCLPAMRLIRSLMVVEPGPLLYACPGLRHRFVGLEIDLLVLQTAPQPLDEDIIHPTSFPIHADADAGRFQCTGKLLTGELRALIGIEDLRRPVNLNGFIQGLQTEGTVHADR